MTNTPQGIDEEPSKILSFEEFSAHTPGGWPKYNNFYLYFFNGDDFERMHRNRPHYKQFAQEHADLAASLRNKFLDTTEFRTDKLGFLRTVERELYEAYVIMRGYGKTDWELFR